MKPLTSAVLALALVFLTGCEGQETETAVTPGTNHPSDVTQPTPPDAAAEAATEENRPRVRLQTSHGEIAIELFAEEAPITVENFLRYVRDGFYDGTAFHRVIGGFMIQGGGFVLENGELVEKETRDPISNEAANNLKNDRGTLAMARTSDPDSATAQFFINLVDNSGLNRPSPDGHGYAVFGRVVEGMDVVDRIAGVVTGRQPLASRHPMNGQIVRAPASDVPVEPVLIESATVVE